MRNLENKFIKRKIDYDKLIQYGFEKEGNDTYTYSETILDGDFEVKVKLSEKEKVSSCMDLLSETEYNLVDIEEAQGKYVGTVREVYELVINKIIDSCTTFNTFIFPQTEEVISYVKEKYGDELEFLWDDFDGAAIRNKINSKWYLVYMVVGEEKVRPGGSDKKIEVIDIKYDKDKVDEVIDNIGIYPGYHMNKHSWISIILDKSEENTKIFELIDKSYLLSGGNKSGMKQKDIAKKIYEYLTKIPKGKVVTYGQIAEYLGNKGLSRIVGTALHQNPDGTKYPCYKVLNGKGELAESYVFGGAGVQKSLLENDGIEVIGNKVDLKKYKWDGKSGL